MKLNSIFYILIFAVFISCQQKKETTDKSTKIDSSKIKTESKSAVTEDLTISGDSSNSDTVVAGMIRKVLSENLLKNELNSIPVEERFFYYSEYDLNSDTKPEYFIGFSNPYFCGTGGCSGFILNNDGTLINQFTVTDFPIYVVSDKTNGWQDLIFKSKGILYNMKNNKGKYPSNPSVEEIWEGDLPDRIPVVLNIYKEKYPKFSF